MSAQFSMTASANLTLTHLPCPLAMHARWELRVRSNAARKDPKAARQTIQLLELEEKVALEMEHGGLMEAGSVVILGSQLQQTGYNT